MHLRAQRVGSSDVRISVALIDYGSGNLRSAAKALERAATDAGHSLALTVSASPTDIAGADHIVLPGVGAFADCMAGLTAAPGLREALDIAVIEKAKPFLGICVGMQLMATTGHEHGDHPGLGWIAGDCVRLEPADPVLKVPHMGWNEVRACRPHALLTLALGAEAPHAYFVHSYHVRPQDPAAVLADAEYGGTIAAVIGRDNMVGVQFHPEKSQAFGLEFLRAFLEWQP